MMMCRVLPRRHFPTTARASRVLGLSLVASGLAAGVAVAAQAPTRAPGSLTIEHQAPGCVAAGKYARVAACFKPQGSLARARVYFRAGGTADWFYVEMAGPPPCLQGVLPRPKKGLERIEYYVAATDRAFAESRTEERVVQVTTDGRCSAGPVAPVADSASVVIGSVSGAAPVGFVTGGGLSPLLIVGGVAVVGGGAAVAIAGGGGGEETPPTTTLPPTTTTLPTTTTTTTDHHDPAPDDPDDDDHHDPGAVRDSQSGTERQHHLPLDRPPVPGLQVTVNANASDPSPGSGVKEVRFYWQSCPGGACGARNLIGSDTSSPYSAVWVFPGGTCDTNPRAVSSYSPAPRTTAGT